MRSYKASELTAHLVEIIELKQDVHPDWVKVLQALVLGAVTKEICESTGGKPHRAIDHKEDSFLRKYAPDHPQNAQDTLNA